MIIFVFALFIFTGWAIGKILQLIFFKSNSTLDNSSDSMVIHNHITEQHLHITDQQLKDVLNN